MKILCALGEHNYGVPDRGTSYEYSNFIPALRNLGHHVVVFESLNKETYLDFADMNRKFLETVQVERPDIILCVLLGYEIWLETLQLVREGTDAIIINWSTDDSWKYEQFSRVVAPFFHLYATTYPTALVRSGKDRFNNFMLTQWAADSTHLSPPVPAQKCKYKVSFVGSCYGNRPKWIADLKKQGIAVECFGYGWENGPVRAEEIPQIMRSSIISLNFGDSGLVVKGIIPSRSRQIKARIFEVPGAGGFLMTEPAEGLEKFYNIDTEIVVFGNIQDLVKKIAYFLDHPDERDRMALAGYCRTRDEHTYEKRFAKLFDVADKYRSTGAEHKTGIDFDRFETVAKTHAVSSLLQCFKALLVTPCLVIWGKKRGARAARRFLFELSWRLAGEKTYTASGWPGRLFYKES